MPSKQHSTLSSKRCPFTGVINLYAADEPHISIGAIARCGTSVAGMGFTWRCLTSEAELSGHAPDLETAKFRLSALLELATVDQFDVLPSVARPTYS